MSKDLEQLKSRMDEVIDDDSVPKNIREAVKKSRQKIAQENKEVSFTNAIYMLDEALNDINVPFHTRTEIMGLISELERLKNE